MRRLCIPLAAATILGAATAPLSAVAAPKPLDPDRAGGSLQLAFTLEEMNCFSSDIQARADMRQPPAGERSRILLAGEASGGTNSIPCAARDPKSPPAWAKQS